MFSIFQIGPTVYSYLDTGSSDIPRTLTFVVGLSRDSKGGFKA